jgi:CDP-diglyceride synthetase
VNRANLARRVATAAVALPLLLAAFFLGPPLLAAGIAAAAVLVGLWEFFGLMKARGLAPFHVPGVVLLAAIFIEVARPVVPASLWPAVALVALICLLPRGTDFSSTVPSAALTLLGAVYLGSLGGAVAALRVLPPDRDGAWRLVLLLSIVMVADSAAFFIGNAAAASWRPPSRPARRSKARPEASPAASPPRRSCGASGSRSFLSATPSSWAWRWPRLALPATSSKACSSGGRG